MTIAKGTITMSKSAAEELKEIHGDIKTLLERVGNIKEWTMQHQQADNESFAAIYRRINGLYTYASAVGIVAFIVGKYMHF